MSKKRWIWQQVDWPNFSYQLARVLPELEAVLRVVAPLSLLASELEENRRLNLELLVLFNETLATAKIEGEILDRESVRSSIATRLGLGAFSRTSRSTQGVCGCFT
ncbi:MAG: DUF4172 domain-containing protein [Thiomicrorhabdus sp.]|nr:DUF4172 domain-containing protein [Thiomicrorhabdus sp.]